MKIRNGFVSNSSLSSFVVFGTGFDVSKMFDILGFDRKTSDNYSEENQNEMLKKLDKIVGNKLDIFLSGEDGSSSIRYIYIGLEQDKLNLTENLLKNAEEVKKKLSRIFPNEKVFEEIRFYGGEESYHIWPDGVERGYYRTGKG